MAVDVNDAILQRIIPNVIAENICSFVPDEEKEMGGEVIPFR